MNKFLILGRTATGKDKLAKILIDNYNWTFVKSYTNRPQRENDDTLHTFVSTEEINNIPESSIIAQTDLNNYHYCATIEQLYAADGYIVDPIGCYQLLNNYPSINFILIYLKPKEYTQQKFFAVARNSHDAKHETKVFLSRMKDENEQFDDFEIKMNTNGLKQYTNISKIITWENTYNEEDIHHVAHVLNRLKNILNKKYNF